MCLYQTAKVRGDDGSAKCQFTDGVILFRNLSAPNLCVKLESAVHVRCPDDVFAPFDLHDVQTFRCRMDGHE